LRALSASDAQPIARLIDDYEVSRWLSVVPHPYSLADAQAFIADFDSDWRFGIWLGDEIAGVIGISDQLGYWLGRRFWGQGYMAEAVHSVVNAWFLAGETSLGAGYFVGNQRSRAILHNIGFLPDAVIRQHSLAQGHDVQCQQLTLGRADWLAANPLCIKTDRLLIRAFAPRDLDAFHGFAADPQVSRMMQSIPHPLGREQARDWIAGRQYSGRLGFCAGVYLHDETLIGSVGIGGDPVSTAYFFDPAHWGQGYATEAMAGFLARMFAWFQPDEITAGAMLDNHASQRVLDKLGFEQTGHISHKSPLRLEPDPLILYRLKRTRSKAMQ